MRFLSVYKTAETDTPPSADYVAKMQALIEGGMKAGWLRATEGCLPSAMGARVRRSSGTTSVTDGPFTESKELIAGFAILEAASKQEAIDLAKTFLDVAGGGECEIRQIFTASDAAPGCAGTTHEQLAEQFAQG